VHVNAKNIPVENVPGIRKGDEGERDGVGSRTIYSIHCKKLCKCYNVPPPSKTIKKI
jgi:hypothetical protein